MPGSRRNGRLPLESGAKKTGFICDEEFGREGSMPLSQAKDYSVRRARQGEGPISECPPPTQTGP